MTHSASRRLWAVGILLLSVMLLNGCSSAWNATKKVGQVIWDPSTPVGQPDEQASVANITLLAEPDINPNESGEAAPVEMNLVYLSEDSRFLAADY
ncbi:type VI secretion system lipoprotein TssJ, partial [Escherichia coli]